MREIRYRAWIKSLSVIADVLTVDFEKEQVLLKGYKRDTWATATFNQVVLMQYTGLKDKNGVEIYEGDIVNITQYFGGHPFGEMKHIIKRSKYNNNLVADSEGGNWRMPEVSMSFRKSDDYEVIGSVYENPELLKELEQ